MSRRGFVFITVAALVVVLACVALLRAFGDAGPGGLPQVPDGAEESAATELVAAEASSWGGRGPAAERSEVAGSSEVAVSADLRADEIAVFRGRTVDEGGTPLAGVVVSVHGSVARLGGADAYEREHGEIEWEDPPDVTTGADGRFEIAVVPPPPFQFSIGFHAQGFAHRFGSWQEIGAGTVKELGDVEMVVGAMVTGRFVDADGVVVGVADPESARLSMFRVRMDQPEEETGTRGLIRAEIAADGTFVIDERVPPGTWRLSARDIVLLEQLAEVEVGAPRTDLEVVVCRPEDLLRVEGIVVDEDGRALAGATANSIGVQRVGNGIVRSGEDGRFAVVQRPGAVDPNEAFQLRVELHGYERAITPKCTWGTRDVRVVLRRIPSLEVLVVRAADRTPVEEYGLRVLSGRGTLSGLERQLIGGWSHVGGLTRVTTLESSGPKRVFIEARAESGLASVLHPVDVDAAAPPRITIELPPAEVQTVRMQFADGTPVVGSRVELIDAAGSEIAAGTRVTDFDSRGHSTHESGVVLDSGETDEHGVRKLSGPASKPLVLRCKGDHPTVVVPGLVLDGGKRVIEVPRGATLRVRLDPIEVLGIWRRAGGMAATGSVDAGDRNHLPSVQVWREVDGGREEFPIDSSRGVAFDTDGVAELHGVPAGTWTVACSWMRQVGAGALVSADLDSGEPVTLTDGEVRDVVVDASAYLTGTVSGTLHLRGVPPGTGRLTMVRPTGETMSGGRPATESASMSVDESGAFAGELSVGEYVAYAPVAFAGTDANVRLTPSFIVRTGERTLVDLVGAVGRTTFRVLDPSGEPVAGLSLWVISTGWWERPAISTTDAEGLMTIVGTPGTYTLRCRLRSLLDDTAYLERRESLRASGANSDAIVAAVAVRLAPVTVEAGDGQELIEIRLPAEWDR